MSDIKVGQILDTSAQKDAVHFALAPVVASQNLKPGTHVRLNADGQLEEGANPIGIVDPFLKNSVRIGQRCWLFLYPQTVTGMRHEWQHPAFTASENAPSSISRKWLLEFANRFGVDVDELIEAAANGNTGQVCGNDDDFGQRCQEQEFWNHIESVTGKHFDSDHRDNTYFRCAC